MPSVVELERLRAIYEPPSVRFELGTVDAVDEPDVSFDVFVCNAVLICLTGEAEVAAALREMRRLLAPGFVGLGEVPTRDELARRAETPFGHVLALARAIFAKRPGPPG